MDDAEEISELIGHIYDASLDPDLWEKVLERAAGFLKTATASIGSFDCMHHHLNFLKSWGYDPHYQQLLLERYAKTNPVNASAWLQRAGDVTSIGDVVPYDEYTETAIFREWGKPQGYIDGLQTTLEKTATALAFFACIRHERHGRVDDEVRRKLRLLTPHLQRAVLIGKVVDLHKVEAAAFADALDGLSAGMFLVDADARLVHANVRGRAMLADGAVVAELGGKLSANDRHVDQGLREIFAAAGGGDKVLGERGIIVPIAAPDGRRFVAHVLALTSGMRRQAGISYSAAAAMFVREAALDLQHPLETLTNLYKFTPAEFRVLMTIVEIGGVPEVASVLGISQTTVKTHLQHIFEKTGLNRQADLVKLVASFMSPLA
jgi:DNA-binding CsgD family transcriptional regulator/PAS domain-containing protein